MIAFKVDEKVENFKGLCWVGLGLELLLCVPQKHLTD